MWRGRECDGVESAEWRWQGRSGVEGAAAAAAAAAIAWELMATPPLTVRRELVGRWSEVTSP